MKYTVKMVWARASDDKVDVIEVMDVDATLEVRQSRAMGEALDNLVSDVRAKIIKNYPDSQYLALVSMNLQWDLGGEE